jgi:type I restriction enzyme M protein
MKIKNAFYSIGEVAKMFGIHEDTLRNWEKENLIIPERIGKRQDRKYSQKHIDQIIEKNLAKLVKDMDRKAPPMSDGKISLNELNSFLWKSADILRGKVNSEDYKKYIFGLLFYKRISDVWDEEYKKWLDELQDEELAKADYNHRFQVPEDCKWNVIEKTSTSIGQRLNAIFDKLTNANSPKLDKIFDDLDFANKDKFPNETVQKLINHFSQYNFGDSYIKADMLGDAYEYLIKQFAAGAGKKGGEFFTPREIERVVVGILKPKPKDHIYDPTCGSGGFLLESYHYVREHFGEEEAKKVLLYGQEMNLDTFAISKINMFLHGLDSADIRRGDTLTDPQFLDKKGGLQTYDNVVANFPYSIKEYNYGAFSSDKYGRIAGYEVPPIKNADYAFILHIVKSMNDTGKAGIVVPHGVLFKTDASGRIREQMIRNDLIEAVIAMPSKLFFGVGIPVALLILNKNKPKERKDRILFIDAEKDYQEGKNQNTLRNQDIQKVISAFDSFKDVEKFAHVADRKEIEENDFNLNVRRFVDSSDEEEIIDVKIVLVELEKVEKERDLADKKVKDYLKELRY